MNKAEAVKEAAKGQSVSRIAKQQDPEVSIDRMDEGFIAYRFSDGSVLMTKGRARAHQMWTL